MTRTEALCKALGWQGGTIHQIATETGVDTQSLLYGEMPVNQHLTSDYSAGWFSVRTCSIEHNQTVNFPKYKGNADFWLGVARGLMIDAPEVSQ